MKETETWVSPSHQRGDEFNGTVVSFDMQSRFKQYRPQRLNTAEKRHCLKMLQGSAADSQIDSVIESDGRLSQHLKSYFGGKEIYTAPGAEFVSKLQRDMKVNMFNH